MFSNYLKRPHQSMPRKLCVRQMTFRQPRDTDYSVICSFVYLRTEYRLRAWGFSLVEIMVVLVIIGLLAGVVTIGTRNYMVKAKANAARTEIATICSAIETYYTVYDRYPTNEEGLTMLTQKTDKLPDPLLQQRPVDPWGRPYQYNQPGRSGPYEVLSLGADGREGGDPGSADEDVGSWALKEPAS